MGRVVLSILVCFLGIFASRFVQAQENDLSYWQTKTTIAPNNALAFFNLGVAYHRQQNYKEALSAYEKVIALRSQLSPVARFYEAQIYNSLGDKKKTKQLLADIPIDSVPANFKKKVLQFKNKVFLEDFTEQNEIDLQPNEAKPEVNAVPTSQEKALSALVDLSFGRNTNPQTLSEATTTSISADQQTQLKAGGGWLASSSEIHEVRFGYYFSGTYFAQQSENNYVYHDVTLPVAFFFDTYRIKFTPEYFTDNYDNQGFSRSIGGSVELTNRFSNSYLSLLVQDQSITNVNPTYAYLSGSQQKAQLSIQSQWSASRFFANLSGSKLNYEDTATLGSSYLSLIASAGYTYILLPFDITFVALFENRGYAKATSDPEARIDKKYYGDIQAGYLFNNNFRFYLDVSQTNNDSNFTTSSNNRAYKQTIALLGVSWSY